MSDTPIQIMASAIRAYLDLLTGEPAPDGGLERLAEALDGLVGVYHRLPGDSEPRYDEMEPQAGDRPRLFQLAAATFPQMHIYPDVDLIDGEALTGFAIDDLGDIAGDLTEVLWWLEQGEEATAIWEYRFGYEHHWGEHLHDVRRYIYSLLFRA